MSSFVEGGKMEALVLDNLQLPSSPKIPTESVVTEHQWQSLSLEYCLVQRRWKGCEELQAAWKEMKGSEY